MRQIDGREMLLMQRHMEEVDDRDFRSVLRGAPFLESNGKIADLKKSPPVNLKICKNFCQKRKPINLLLT